MMLRLDEIILIRIAFHQTPGGKVRPTVVLLDSGDEDFVAAPITSRPRTSDSCPTLTRGRSKHSLDEHRELPIRITLAPRAPLFSTPSSQ